MKKTDYIRVRFAPSPTGHVHIGNIRTAIFNWLFARHEKGKFLLRIEDTDKERSTSEAINTLLSAIEWMGLDYDEEVVYQSSLEAYHIKAAEKLLKSEKAYKPKSKEDSKSAPIYFRIPYYEENKKNYIRTVGEAEIRIHPDVPVEIDETGIHYAAVSKKGKPIAETGSFAGFKNLRITDKTGKVVFELTDEIYSNVVNGTKFSFPECVKFNFLRREIFFTDIIKGELAKPLDSIKDIIIVRSDGTPVFHLANVCDDIHQNITHIIRGDDHVENTFRHIMLFTALDSHPPFYAHLPMIVNNTGKPYSKRDGDAFVGDFKQAGYLAEALFNYLTLLGWSPGNDKEKMSKSEIIENFSLERVKSAPAKFDIKKLTNLNYQYLCEKSANEFVKLVEPYFKNAFPDIKYEDRYFEKVAKLMQSRTKVLSDCCKWKYFFTDNIEYDEKAVKKFLSNPNIKDGLAFLYENLKTAEAFDENTIEKYIRQAERHSGISEGKLNQPLRITVTGQTTGAGIYETIALLGKKNTLKRIKRQIHP